MRTLIVHDRDEVIETLTEICRSCGCNDVEVAKDASAARDFLVDRTFDLLILDLTIPHYYKGPLDYANASNLLRDIQLDQRLFAPGDVIGITKDEAAVGV